MKTFLAKLAAMIFGDPGLIKLTKQQRILGALMTNDTGNHAERIETLRAQLVDYMEQTEILTNTAQADGRDLTEDEDKLHAGLMDSFRKAKNEISRLEEMQANAEFMRQPAPNQNRPDPNTPDASNVGRQAPQSGRGGGKPRIEVVTNKGTDGFRHMGEFARAVMVAANKVTNAGQIDPRLMLNAPTTYSQEAVGADGGFLVPTEYRDAIMLQVMGEDSLLSRCDEFNTSRNNIVVPQDTTTPYGTNGIVAYWEGEASQHTQSKPQFKEKQARLSKLTALVPVTEEMLDDSPLIGSYLNSKAPEAIGWKVNDGIVNGTGAGMPMGFMNSGALVTVAKETSQVADTIIAENIDKMWARMRARSWRNAVWLINQDVMPELDNMVRVVKNVAGSENVGGIPAYMPANGLSTSPYGTLKGRPVIPVESMQTLGDLGDIALVDLTQYMAATKAGGIRQDVSMHLWFDYDMAAFKFQFRMAGSPWFNSTVTPANSTNTLSPFVTLAARA